MLTNRTRLLLTILAVAWGTFSICSMLAVGEGLRLTFGNAMHSMGQGALVVTGKQTTRAFHGQSNGIQISLTQHDLDQLKRSLQGRADITGSIAWDIPLYYGEKTSHHAPTTAILPDYGRIHAIHLIPGSRFINLLDDVQHRQVIVLGNRTYIKFFKPHENAIGKTIYLKDKPFLIVGVQRKSVELVATNQYPDEFTNWIPYSTYQEITNSYNYSNFIIAPFQLDQVDALQTEIRHYIAMNRHLNPEDPGILDFINIQKEKEKINIFFYGIEVVLGIMGSLTLIVAGVGIANVMYMSVRRATREIGIRMALGAQPYEILLYYVIEALLTTFIGGMTGVLLTEGLVMIVAQIPMDSEILQYFGSPRPVLSMVIVLVVISILGIIGILAGFFPARKAANIHPAEALRYE